MGPIDFTPLIWFGVIIGLIAAGVVGLAIWLLSNLI